MDRLQAQTIAVHIPKAVSILPNNSSASPLFKVLIKSTLHVPLIADVPLTSRHEIPDWLQTTTFQAIVEPMVSTGQVWDYIQRTWTEGVIRISAVVDSLEADLQMPGVQAWWSEYAKGKKEDLLIELAVAGKSTS